MYDPGFKDRKSINSRKQEAHQRKRNGFHPNPYDPEQEIYTYENQLNTTDGARIIRKYLLTKKEDRKSLLNQKTYIPGTQRSKMLKSN